MCVKATHIYGSESFYYSLSENDMVIGNWATIPAGFFGTLRDNKKLVPFLNIGGIILLF